MSFSDSSDDEFSIDDMIAEANMEVGEQEPIFISEPAPPKKVKKKRGPYNVKARRGTGKHAQDAIPASFLVHTPEQIREVQSFLAGIAPITEEDLSSSEDEFEISSPAPVPVKSTPVARRAPKRRGVPRTVSGDLATLSFL